MPGGHGGTKETGDSNISDTASAVASTVLAEASDGGSISPAGEIEVDVGQTVTFELTPNEGCFGLRIGKLWRYAESFFTTEPVKTTAESSRFLQKKPSRAGGLL